MVAEELYKEDFTKAFEDDILHRDFTHYISLGYNKEQYFLVFVIRGINFLWAGSTTTCQSQEELLQGFLSAMRLKIGCLRVNGEFTLSHFQAFCNHKGIDRLRPGNWLTPTAMAPKQSTSRTRSHRNGRRFLTTVVSTGSGLGVCICLGATLDLVIGFILS